MLIIISSMFQKGKSCEYFLKNIILYRGKSQLHVVNKTHPAEEFCSNKDH